MLRAESMHNFFMPCRRRLALASNGSIILNIVAADHGAAVKRVPGPRPVVSRSPMYLLFNADMLLSLLKRYT